jgi:hypothetical protein
VKRFTVVLLLSLACAPTWLHSEESAQYVLGSADQGCTASPDIAGGIPCLNHDSAYWVGGTEEDRLIADAQLFYELILYGVPEDVASMYYRVVRELGWTRWPYKKQRTRGPPR